MALRQLKVGAPAAKKRSDLRNQDRVEKGLQKQKMVKVQIQETHCSQKNLPYLNRQYILVCFFVSSYKINKPNYDPKILRISLIAALAGIFIWLRSVVYSGARKKITSIMELLEAFQRNDSR